jgi:hypothetical protein
MASNPPPPQPPPPAAGAGAPSSLVASEEQRQRPRSNSRSEPLVDLSQVLQQGERMYQKALRIHSLTARTVQHYQAARSKLLIAQGELSKQLQLAQALLDDISAKQRSLSEQLQETVIRAEEHAREALDGALADLKTQMVDTALSQDARATLFDYVDTNSIASLLQQIQSEKAVLANCVSAVYSTAIHMKARMQEISVARSRITATFLGSESEVKAASQMLSGSPAGPTPSGSLAGPAPMAGGGMAMALTGPSPASPGASGLLGAELAAAKARGVEPVEARYQAQQEMLERMSRAYSDLVSVVRNPSASQSPAAASASPASQVTAAATLLEQLRQGHNSMLGVARELEELAAQQSRVVTEMSAVFAAVEQFGPQLRDKVLEVTGVMVSACAASAA